MKLLFLFIFISILSGCGWITEPALQESIRVCSIHNGLKRVSAALSLYGYDVVCTDGTEIKFWIKEK
jgi:hypothetical protein